MYSVISELGVYEINGESVHPDHDASLRMRVSGYPHNGQLVKVKIGNDAEYLLAGDEIIRAVNNAMRLQAF
jgi:hypothetical protein